MQFGLINSYSSLLALEKFEPEALSILKKQLIGTGEDFLRLRRGTSSLLRFAGNDLIPFVQVLISSFAISSRSW